MNYVEAIKDEEDLRVPNKLAFKMEQVYSIKLDKFIDYYDYEEATNSDSGDESLTKINPNADMRK